MTRQRERFRAALAGDTCVYPANVFDPISARIAEIAGYELAMLSGSVAAAVALAVPDLVLISLKEMTDQVRAICRATDLSVFVDADHGYGNALNVMRTVEELEDAGAAALTIEDVDMPQRFGKERPGLISLEEMLGKLKAALAARKDPSLIIIARTSALGYEEPEVALGRIKAYTAAGVDGLFLAGAPRGRDDVAAVHEASPLPLMLARTPPPLRDDPAFLKANNVRIGLEGWQPFLASIKAVHDTMVHLKGGRKIEELEGQQAAEELLGQVTRRDQFSQRQRDYLSV